MRASSKSFLVLLGTFVLAGMTLTPGMALGEEEGGAESQSIASGDRVSWGVGVRLRQVRMPESVIELFVADAPGGGTHTGYGLEIVRQRGNFTLAVGVQHEDLSIPNGIWIDNGGAADLVRFDGFGWTGVDLSFIWQAGLIGEVLSLRYGAGLGVGLLHGEVRQTDYVCENGRPDACVQDPNAEDIEALVDLPPVFPIVNVLVGLQIRPVESIAINIEGGIRTVPFVGTTVAFMF